MNIDDIIESARLKGRVIALEAEVQTLQAEVRCLEAVIRSHERVDCLTVANLKAELARLRASSFTTAVPSEDYEKLKAENDRLKADVRELIDEASTTHCINARLHSQFANSEQENARLNDYIERLEVRNAELVPENARLKAEVDALMTNPTSRLLRAKQAENAVLAIENDSLKAEVERLEPELEQRCRELNLSLAQQAIQLRQIGELKAEVERLRIAGDEMHRAIKVSDPILDWKIELWNAAKEGKPSEQKSPSFIEDLGNGVEKHDLLFRYPAKEGKQS